MEYSLRGYELAEVGLGWQACTLLEITTAVGQDQVPDLIVVEERSRDYVVDVDQFARQWFVAIEIEAVLIAIQDWVGAGDVDAGVSTRAIEYVLVGA